MNVIFAENMKEYENFEGDMKRKKIAKYGIISNVLYEWHI